jgi:hypothetical protein
MFAIQMLVQRDKPVAALAEVSNLGELDNVASSSNLVVTTVASRCEKPPKPTYQDGVGSSPRTDYGACVKANSGSGE